MNRNFPALKDWRDDQFVPSIDDYYGIHYCQFPVSISAHSSEDAEQEYC